MQEWFRYGETIELGRFRPYATQMSGALTSDFSDPTMQRSRNTKHKLLYFQNDHND